MWGGLPFGQHLGEQIQDPSQFEKGFYLEWNIFHETSFQTWKEQHLCLVEAFEKYR